MSRTLLDVVGISKRYRGITALDGVSLTISEGELVSLIGPNGSGKTTLFNVITGFVVPETGSVTYKGVPLTGLTPEQIARLGVGRTFQNIQLIRGVSVLDNLLFSFSNQCGERLHDVFFRQRSVLRQENELKERALVLLEQFGLANLAYRMPDSISFGQRKRLGLACCLATGSDLLLLDEPFAGLDPAAIDLTIPMIESLSSQGKSIILIDHSFDVLSRLSDRIVFLAQGAVLRNGRPEMFIDDYIVLESYLG